MRKFFTKALGLFLTVFLVCSVSACERETTEMDKNVIVIMLDYNGGVGTAGTLEIEENAEYTLETPTKKGYAFIGWELDGETLAQSGTWTKTGEYVVLKAKWEAEIYTITYEYTGGLSHKNPTTYTVEDGEIILLAPDADKDFLGWFDQATGGFQVKTLDTSQAQSITLYARWKTSSENDGWGGRYEG